ncbi:MAG: hypothetical protein GEV11_16580 [Streptosporangiales bacterium]|nr:hypothetical protein [Streptosporangiales bacterium]
MVAVVHTLPHDLALAQHRRPPTARFGAITAPTLMLAGSNSPVWMRHAARTIAETVSVGSHRELPGQEHVRADDVLAPVLREFLLG